MGKPTFRGFMAMLTCNAPRLLASTASASNLIELAVRYTLAMQMDINQ